MFDLDAFIANKDLILKDRDNRADVQKVLSVYAEKVGSTYTVKAKWSDIFDALLQGMKVQAQVITLTEADEEEETDASAVVETYDLYDATVTADGFNVNGTDLSASGADAYPVGSLSRPSSGGGGGGGASVLFVTETVGDGKHVLDHTAGEIIEAMPLVYIKDESPDGATIFLFSPLTDEEGNPQGAQCMYFYNEESGGYNFFRGLDRNSAPMFYQAATLDDYPAYEGGII